MKQWRMDSIIGPLYLVASENALHGVFWKKAKHIEMAAFLSREKILAQAAAELEEYLGGGRKIFTVPLDVQGTNFQKQVWGQLAKIPYGSTFSYKEIAARIKNKNAVRAVGTANGRNPISIIIPCHRVIAANGTLGGYAGGLTIKSKLLKLEARAAI